MASNWFPALSEPQIRLYLVGQFVSMLGSWVMDITLNLLVWEETGSPAMLGVLNFLLYGPAVLITPVVGSRLSADNALRITVYVLCSAVAVAVVLLAAAATQSLPVALLMAAAVLRGVLGGMEVPSRQMLLMNISGGGSCLTSAIAMNTVVFLLARTLGPALAAFIFEPLGPAFAFALAAAATGFMLACVLRLRPLQAEEILAGKRRSGFSRAWDFVRTDRLASLLLPVVACVGACVSAYQTLIPVLASQVFGDAALWTGRFFASAGCGALVAALLLSSRHLGTLARRFLLAAPWSGVLALAMLGASTHSASTLACFVVLGFCTSFIGTGTNAVLHERVPPEARGGLIGLFLLAFSGTMPIGQLVAGIVASYLSPAAALFLLSALLCASLLVLCGRRWRTLGRVEWDLSRL